MSGINETTDKIQKHTAYIHKVPDAAFGTAWKEAARKATITGSFSDAPIFPGDNRTIPIRIHSNKFDIASNLHYLCGIF